jgi:hypothetical protein
MSHIVTFARSRPSPIWFHQGCKKTLSSATPDLILPPRSHQPTVFQPITMPISTSQNRTTAFIHKRTCLPSRLCQPFNAHRPAVVQRFSPIHF